MRGRVINVFVVIAAAAMGRLPGSFTAKRFADVILVVVVGALCVLTGTSCVARALGVIAAGAAISSLLPLSGGHDQ